MTHEMSYMIYSHFQNQRCCRRCLALFLLLFARYTFQFSSEIVNTSLKQYHIFNVTMHSRYSFFIAEVTQRRKKQKEYKCCMVVVVCKKKKCGNKEKIQLDNQPVRQQAERALHDGIRWAGPLTEGTAHNLRITVEGVSVSRDRK